MVEVLFKEFVSLCKKLEKTQSRKEKVRILTEFMSKIGPDNARIVALLISGKIFPEYEDLKLDVGLSTVYKVLKSLKSGQTLLLEKPSTLKEIYNSLRRIALIRGEGSRRKKEESLRSLLLSLSEDERECLLRAIFGEMRVGVNEGMILEALSYALRCNLEVVRRAYMFIGDIGELTSKAFTNGCEGLKNVTLELFRPVKPMLASMVYSVVEALKEHGGICAFEFKYDGVRIQVHKKNDKVRIFTRRLTDVTVNLPDIVDLVKNNIKASTVVLDGEVISLRNGKPLPFQELVKRIRRQKELPRLLREIPLIPKFFDILFLDGQVLVDLPYKERWSFLEENVDAEFLSERIITEDLKEAENFFKKSIESGHEGLMAKDLSSVYTPGIRGKKWLKIKTADTIDAVIVAAEWGHGRRRGWLSDYYLAVLDDFSGGFTIVGKTFKGLTDEEFKEMTKRLLQLKVREEGYRIFVKPSIVVEVAYSEIQKSPKYRSGLALRFARITRIRYDKSPYDVTTLSELKRRYEEQFLRKQRRSK
ncbi:MAG: hypothetical protein DRJ38_02450 [Thermoprotei archaeon]|nr:MAG: hypothetical protein DRJ38_02450 [Thermoprotei archaeon]